MPRPKTFDPDAVLDRAVDLFWTQGYESVSVQDLVDHLGISRSSLYQTFGDKQSLWLAALDRYRHNEEAEARLLEESDSGPLDAIRHYFQSVIDQSASDTYNRGCFLANAIVERGPTDAETSRRAHYALESLQHTFERVVRAAQEKGEIATERDALALGRYLANAAYGLRVTARIGLTRAVMSDVVTQTLASLE